MMDEATIQAMLERIEVLERRVLELSEHAHYHDNDQSVWREHDDGGGHWDYTNPDYPILFQTKAPTVPDEEE